MRNLIRRARLRPGALNDRGAIGITIGILFGAGVLLGAAAIAVDVGQLYTERAELQSGAEAGALAVAKACATEQPECDLLGEAEDLAEYYAERNAADEAADLDPGMVSPVCGSITSGVFPVCPPSSGELIDCPDPNGDYEYVDVHTSTKTDEGQTLLPPAFARALVNSADYDGTRVHACARAAWGTPSAADGLRLTLSWCEWNEATAGGTLYAPQPPEIADPSFEQVIKLRDPGSNNPNNPPPTCDAPGSSGQDLPGGFGWIDPADGNTGSCDAHVEQDGTYYPTPGSAVPGTCNEVLIDAYDNFPTALVMPIYVGHPEGQGNTGQYTIWEPAAFVVTGWRNLPSMQAGDNSRPSLLTGVQTCGSGGGSCIFGYFTTGITSGDLGEGDGAGVSVIKLTG